MLRRLRRWVRQFFTRTRSINKQPLNPVSLIVIILIDIFILVNVFNGLNDISSWALSPNDAYPCYQQWRTYREDKSPSKNIQQLENALREDYQVPSSYPSAPPPRASDVQFAQAGQGRLGTVSSTCLAFGATKEKIDTPANRNVLKSIDQKQNSINSLENSNRNIRAQYDSTLLEKIAGQNRDQSINAVGAEKAKAQLDSNNEKIAQLKSEIAKLEADLLAKPESAELFKFLANNDAFNEVERGYKNASFWYPTIQLSLQALFLLPLLIGAGLIYQFAERKRYGLIALICWHLLIIFFIPLILKIFEVLQVGALFQFLFDIISKLFGGLVFLVSYAYILIIPIAGFILIKVFQKINVRSKPSPSALVQQSRCLSCTRTLRNNENYCPHCGYHQHLECHNCHQLTYK
ncbi:hypothetical protein IQ250_27625, partial [Pseudanabaenaceae cyanobacterium LEGE 13415]|nr:hypothetical protein [Pseudanabaenaceae cyanobacterium LEGE 13415]